MWLGAISRRGYGRVRVGRKTYQAHRVAFLLSGQTIPAGLLLRHTCDNRWCVSPAHLIPGTVAENVGDMVYRGRAARGVGMKLTEAAVHHIRRREMSQNAYADLYGVDPSTIYKIQKGIKWRHLKPLDASDSC